MKMNVEQKISIFPGHLPCKQSLWKTPLHITRVESKSLYVGYPHIGLIKATVNLIHWCSQRIFTLCYLVNIYKVRIPEYQLTALCVSSSVGMRSLKTKQTSTYNLKLQWKGFRQLSISFPFLLQTVHLKLLFIWLVYSNYRCLYEMDTFTNYWLSPTPSPWTNIK